jgi:hypothetical protein
MTSQATSTPLALPAGDVDLSHDSSAEQLSFFGLHHFPDKLVTGNSPEAVVAATEFHIRVADACAEEANHGPAWPFLRSPPVNDLYPPPLKLYCNHVLSPGG